MFHKIACRGFGGFHAGRFDIVGCHAAGYVKSQDDGAFLLWQGYHRLRACQGNGKNNKTDQEENG